MCPTYTLDDRNYAPRDHTVPCTFDHRGVFSKLCLFIYLKHIANGGHGAVCNWARLDRNNNNKNITGLGLNYMASKILLKYDIHVSNRLM